MRRALLSLLIAATAMVVVPATASAHGLVQRSNLPIPEWLFGWAAAIVLVISFVALAALWPKPRMEGRTPWRPLPGGAVLGSRPVEIVCGAIGVALLVVVVLAGYVGSGVALDNFAPDVHPDHVLGRARLPQRALRRRLPGLQPVAGAGPAAAVEGPAARTPRSSAAGPRRSGC